jgi:DNA modification methylase
MCGDSTDKNDVDKLMDGQKADMVFTDPPFPNNSQILHEYIESVPKAFENVNDITCQVWFWDNISDPPFGKVTARHVWHKTNGWQAGHWESINVFHGDFKRRECLVFSFPNVGQDGEIGTRKSQGFHPTPKPISLISSILDYMKCPKTVLDLFLGSGSTLIACEKTNRQCFGMELDEHYCSVIIKRWEDFTGEKAVQWVS